LQTFLHISFTSFVSPSSQGKFCSQCSKGFSDAHSHILTKELSPTVIIIPLSSTPLQKGVLEGIEDRSRVGRSEGTTDGEKVGILDEMSDGLCVRECDGNAVGSLVGTFNGPEDGS